MMIVMRVFQAVHLAVAGLHTASAKLRLFLVLRTRRDVYIADCEDWSQLVESAYTLSAPCSYDLEGSTHQLSGSFEGAIFHAALFLPHPHPPVSSWRLCSSTMEDDQAHGTDAHADVHHRTTFDVEHGSLRGGRGPRRRQGSLVTASSGRSRVSTLHSLGELLTSQIHPPLPIGKPPSVRRSLKAIALHSCKSPLRSTSPSIQLMTDFRAQPAAPFDTCVCECRHGILPVGPDP